MKPDSKKSYYVTCGRALTCRRSRECPPVKSDSAGRSSETGMDPRRINANRRSDPQEFWIVVLILLWPLRKIVMEKSSPKRSND